MSQRLSVCAFQRRVVFQCVWFAGMDSVRYLSLPRLMEELDLTHGAGRFAKLMASDAKTDLLILDYSG